MLVAVESDDEAYGPFEPQSRPYPPPETAQKAAEATGLGFARQRYNVHVEGDWIFEGTLGAGGYGNAGLWGLYDNNGNRTRRLVAKESYLTKGWDNVRYWEGDMERRLPREYVTAKYLADLPDSDNIVHAEGYGIYDTRQMYRLLMEFCPHGDLNSLLSRAVQLARLKRDRGLDLFIPPRVLWSIFESLASGLCIMHLGYLPTEELERPEDVRAVQHRDLKPLNVFLASPDEKYWPRIPTAKVGDFGLTLWNDHGTAKKGSGGTRGWKAPERFEYTYDLPDFSLPSDVWSLGRIMLTLMTLTNLPEDVKYGSGNETPEVFPAAATRYGDMYGLAIRCLAPQPDDRPPIEDVWQEIRDAVNEKKRGQKYPLNLSKLKADEMWTWGPDKYADLARDLA